MKNTQTLKNDFVDVLKAVLFATLISLAFVLLFAVIIKFASLPSAVIMPINIAIKILSIFLGAIIGFKHKQNGLVKGAIAGLVYMLFTFLIFAALSSFKDIRFSWIDLITLPIAGAISGIIAVNLKRKEKVKIPRQPRLSKHKTT